MGAKVSCACMSGSHFNNLLTRAYEDLNILWVVNKKWGLQMVLLAWKKKKASAVKMPVGKLETSYEDLKNEHGDAALTGRLYGIDICELIPELAEMPALPRVVHERIRAILDDYLKEGEEWYFQAGPRTFGLFLPRTKPLVVELKTEAIRNELTRVIKILRNRKFASRLEQPEVQDLL